jgi:hypothetical protein
MSTTRGPITGVTTGPALPNQLTTGAQQAKPWQFAMGAVVNGLKYNVTKTYEYFDGKPALKISLTF